MPEQHKPSVLDGILSALESTVLAKVPEGARPAARQELRVALAGAQADGYRIGWEDAAAIGPATSLGDLLYDETGPGAEPVHVHAGCGLDCQR